MDQVQEIGLGGALFATILIIKDVLAKLLSKLINGDKVAQMSAAELDQRIERAVERVVENKLQATLIDIKQSITTLIRWKGGD